MGENGWKSDEKEKLAKLSDIRMTKTIEKLEDILAYVIFDHSLTIIHSHSITHSHSHSFTHSLIHIHLTLFILGLSLELFKTVLLTSMDKLFPRMHLLLKSFSLNLILLLKLHKIPTISYYSRL